MFRNAANVTPNSPFFITTINRKMSTLIAAKLPKPIANDGKAAHADVCRQECVINDCPTKKCDTLCDKLKKTVSLGQVLYAPTVGSYYRVLSDYDANGIG